MIFHRFESALEDLEKSQTKAAELGSAAYEAHQAQVKTQSFEDAQDLGIAPEGSDSSSSTDTSSSDSSSSDSSSGDSGGDSGGDTGGGDDFDFGGDFGDSDGGDDSDDSDEGGEDDAEESGEDAEEDSDESEEEDKEEEKDEKKEEEDKKDDEVRTESLRLKPIAIDVPYELRAESFADSAAAVGNFLWNVGGYVVDGLAAVGLRFLPWMAKGFFKIVLFTFAKTFGVLDDVFSAVSLRIERMLKSNERLKGQLKGLHESLQAKVEAGETPDPEASFDPSVDYLVGDSENLAENVKEFSERMQRQVILFQKKILGEFQALNFIASNRYLQRNFDALEYIQINPGESGFSPLSGPEMEEEFVGRFQQERLIGNVALTAVLPNVRLDNWEAAEKAYRNSSIYLTAIPTTTMKEYQARVPSHAEFVVFLNNLESLLGASVQHQKLYETILARRSGVMTTIKALFVKLGQSVSRSSFKNSTALPLYLKSSFVSKVYVVGAMDLQDHTARVLANGLSYASEVLKTYKKKA